MTTTRPTTKGETMTKTRTATDIMVYWDAQDPRNEGWAYRASDADGMIESGAIDDLDGDDLDGAIEDACSQLGVDIRADAFAREPNIDGGYATWSAER